MPRSKSAMRFSGFLSICFFSLFAYFNPLVFAAEKTVDLSSRFDKLDARLGKLEKQQAQIIENQQKILAQLDVVRIRASHH